MAQLGQPTLPVLLIAASSALMVMPMVHALVLEDRAVASAFASGAALTGTLALLLWLASRNRVIDDPLRVEFRGFILSYLFLPPILALPFHWAVPESDLLAAWWEMISCMTTTGASLFPNEDVPPPVHLWRGLVGWGGGFLTLVAAAAILAPLNIGGFEVLAPKSIGRARLRPAGHDAVARRSLERHAKALAFPYIAFTLALWALLHVAGDSSLVALMHGMAVMSTSGISPVDGLHAAGSGRIGEMLMFAALLLTLSRRLLPWQSLPATERDLRDDPELRTAFVVLLAASIGLLFHLQFGRNAPGITQSFQILFERIWGVAFTTLSFLTTTGFSSADWTTARSWSDFQAPGMVLLGLAMIGGGVATTAGGVTLLRVHALSSLCRREMERLSEPTSVGGGGVLMRQLRQEGAFLAFVFFVLFAFSLGVINLVLAALGLDFDEAIIFSVAALSTTGHAASSSGLPDADWAALPDLAKFALAVTMIVGRLETLALLAFMMPATWRS